MATIPPVEDTYIDDVIIASGPYNPNLNKTQGVQLRALVKQLRDGLEQQISVAKGNYIYQTYSELTAVMAANNLVPGQQYVLTDYNTQYIQPVTNATKTDAPKERLLFTAATSSTFSKKVSSLDFPDDSLEFDFTNNLLLAGMPGTYGVSYSQSEIIPGAVNAYVAFVSLGFAYWENQIQTTVVGSTDMENNLDLSFSPFKIVVFTTDQTYSGTGFNILVNGVVYPVSPEQVIFFNDDIINNSTTIATVNGNCKVQVYNSILPDYVSLPDTAQGTPDTLRNGWISRRVDDKENDTPFDNRNVLTWGQITPGQKGYLNFQIDATMPPGTEYDDATICLGYIFDSGFTMGAVQTMNFYGRLYQGNLPYGDYAVYAIGKCAVESYCLVNGVQYTIPPFDNKISDINIQGTQSLVPIVTVPQGNVYLQLFADAGNIPAYIPLPDVSADVAAVMGEVPIFGSNCERNFIETLPNGNIPQISFGNFCTDNKCLGASDLIFLTDYCIANTFQDSSASVLADINGNPGNIYQEFYTYSSINVLNGSGNVFTIMSTEYLSGSYNTGYHSGNCFINGDNNIFSYSDNAYVVGDNNNNGQNISEGKSNSYIYGSNNISPCYINQRFIKGNGNVFINSPGALDFTTIIGDNNEINGIGCNSVYGNRNVFFFLGEAGYDGVINGDDNYLNTQCGKVTTGKGFNSNKLENVQNVIYGNYCSGNYELNILNVDRGDNYTNHKPWTT